MPRTLSASLACLLGALLAACSGPGSGSERPNLVLVIVDTLRADKLSSYGYPLDTSPALTRLAERGVQFESVAAQTSWTLPSVGSMLTSQYPRTLGLYSENAQQVPDGAKTLAEVLRDAGYTTFGITANPNLNSHYNFDQGFDEYHDSMVVFAQSREDVPEGQVYFKDASLRTAPEVFDEVLTFARKVRGARPAYVQIDLMEVHEYFSGELRRPEYDGMFAEDPNANYLQMIRQVTDDLEVFVDELSAVPGWANTLFVVTSDHGEGLSDHPSVESSRGHGALLYASHLEVPWIMFHPTWRPARERVLQRVRLLDLMPTLLDFADVPAPGGMEGVSVMPLVDGEVERLPLPEFIVTETHFRDFRKVSVLGGNWQFLENRQDHVGLPRFELQTWQGVPDGKQTNRLNENRPVAKRMRDFLLEWEARYDEVPPTPIEGEVDEAMLEQLQHVGYLDGEDEDDE